MLCSSFQTFFSLCHVLAFPKQSNFLPSTFQMGLLKSWLSSTYHTPENLLLAAPLRIVFFGLKYKSTCLIYSTVFENHRNKSHFHRDQSGLAVRSISIWQKSVKMPKFKCDIFGAFQTLCYSCKNTKPNDIIDIPPTTNVIASRYHFIENKAKSWQKLWNETL